MRGMMIWIVIGLCACRSLGDTYFIRSSGSDRNDGLTPATALGSLEHFAEIAKPGDTVYIGAGEYTERARFQTPATPGQPIRIIGDISGEHTGDAGQVVLTSSSNSQIVQLTRADHHQLSGLRFAGGQEGVRIDGAQGIVLQGCSFDDARESSVSVINNGSVEVRGCQITSRKRGVHVTNGDAVVLDSDISDLQTALELHNSGSGIEARRVDIRRVGRGAYARNGELTLVNVLIAGAGNEGVLTQNQTTLVMVHCTVYDTAKEGARFRGNSTLYNNIFATIGSHCMRLDGGRVTASHNLVHNRRGDRSYRFNSLEFEFDPMFTDPDAGDFSLSSVSEAIDIGMDAGSFTELDLAANARPVGEGFDPGAYEGAPPLVLYVRTRGSDNNNGLSPQNALRTINEAISRAVRSGATIHVGPGTYSESLQIGTGSGSGAASGSSERPMRLIADVSGTETLDDPGPVLLQGDGQRTTAMELRDVDHWSIEGFTIRGYRGFGVRATNSGFTLMDAHIEVPSRYALYATVDTDIAVRGCRFERDAGSGHIAWIQPTRGVQGVQVEFVGNDATLRDERYLSTSLRQGRIGAGEADYGVIVYGLRDRFGAIEISNNQFSDLYLPIYVYNNNAKEPVWILNNTVVGSLYSIYAAVQRGSSIVTVNNTIIDQCYFGLVTIAQGSGRVRVTGLLEHQIAYNMSGFGRHYEFEIIKGDPSFFEPERGDFSLYSFSPAVDAGTMRDAPGTDIGGRSRPSDGDDDGVAQADLGAYEQVHEGGRDRVRVVRWREIGGDQDR